MTLFASSWRDTKNLHIVSCFGLSWSKLYLLQYSVYYYIYTIFVAPRVQVKVHCPYHMMIRAKLKIKYNIKKRKNGSE